MNKDNSNSEKRRPLRFKILSIAVGLLPIVLLEIVLRMLGYGAHQHDPYAEFAGNVPVFARVGSEYHTAKQREPYLARQQFSAHKASNVFRIFCFGGSTVHGRPYQTETAFPKWLELELNILPKGKKYEVINCGGISYASYRIAPMIREVINYQPDLIVLATGHNEFLEDRTYEQVKKRGWTRRQLDSLRIVSTGRRLLQRIPSKQESTDTEFETRLDALNGYASYKRDPAWQRRVTEQFHNTLNDIADTCEQAQVPLMLVRLGSNLRDCPPFKSALSENLSPGQERKWMTFFEQGSELQKTNLVAALNAYREAAKIDDSHALLNYRIARLEDRSETGNATLHYRRALEEDLCPLRILPAQIAVLESLAKQRNLQLVNAGLAIANASDTGLPGFDWYVDHVHPTIGGHQIIAQALADEIRAKDYPEHFSIMLTLQRIERHAAHVDRLGIRYFADGKRRVRWLEQWARRERLAEEVAPKSAHEFMRKCFRALDFGDYVEARSAFDEAMKINPGLAEEKLDEHGTKLFNQGRRRASRVIQQWLGRSLFQRSKQPKKKPILLATPKKPTTESAK